MLISELVAGFRKIAEDTERRARKSGVDRLTQADLMDAAAKCHWLAGEASALCRKLGQVPAACEACLEKCPQPPEQRSILEAPTCDAYAELPTNPGLEWRLAR